jgi:hypothetical protein
MSPEPPSSSGLPPRGRPALSDLSRETTEGDLWNLDDELADGATPKPILSPQPRRSAGSVPAVPAPDAAPAPERLETRERPAPRDPLERKHAPPPAADEMGDLEEATASVAEPALRVIPEEQPAAPPAEAPLSLDKPAGPSSLPAAAEPETAAPRPNQRRPEIAAKAQAAAIPSLPRLNRREVLGIAAFAFSLLLIAIWVLSRVFSAFEFRSEFVKGPDFPVTGQHLTLAAADTYWREPVRSGETRDFARREVTMIPVLELSLDPAKSANGALLVIFRNSEGEPVGDSIRRSFSGGRFDASGDPTIAFPSTDGFIAAADFNAYRSGKGKIWMADILEGPSVDAPADRFQPLASLPVIPKLR